MAAVSVVGSPVQAGPTQRGHAIAQPTSVQRGGNPGQSPIGNPIPGSIGVSIETDLSWLQALNTFSYNVYFGTDSTPDATEFLGNTARLSFSLDTLEWDTTYFWRIDSVGLFTLPGFTWFFTTEPQPTPDLNITDVIYTTPGSFHPGDELFVTTIVQNDGNAATDVVTIRYYASLDDVITQDDIFIGIVNNAFDLPIGEDNFIARSLVLSDDFPAGDYYFGAYATDLEGLDTNLSNNGRADSKARTVLPPRFDLRAWVYSYDECISYSLGDTIDVTSSVFNTGDLPVTEINLDFYASTDSTITRDDILLGEIDFFGSLDDGTTWVVDDTPVLLVGDNPAEILTPGTYYIGIYVREGVNDDENLANNGLAGEFPITIIGPCPADLTNDGTLDFFDIAAFLTPFSNQEPVADFTGDTLLNFFDIAAFLTAFGDGCP